MATEGINGTVGGTETATRLYIKAMLAHPIFQVMHVEDFKVNKESFKTYSTASVYKTMAVLLNRNVSSD